MVEGSELVLAEEPVEEVVVVEVEAVEGEEE
jgi:hypothetical protein